MLRAAAAPRVRLPQPRLGRPFLVAALIAAVLGGGYLWVRDSSLVRVERVVVTGLTGPEAPRVSELLTNAARDMTTLHVDEQALRELAERYPIIAGLEVHRDLPHDLRIVVHERTPVALLELGGERVPISADGTLLRGAAARDLPVLGVPGAARGDRVAGRRATAAVAALAAAPAELRDRIVRAGYTRDGGLVLDLRDGPDLRFGVPDRLEDKWAATVAVLADKSSAGAAYLDVRHPERPAAGGLEDPATQLDPEAANAASAPAAEGAATTVPVQP